jgi:hypothetical protein
MIARADASTPLGVLSVHLEGDRCRVGCDFCYLGARSDTGPARADLDVLETMVERLDFAELAVAVSNGRADLAAASRLGAVAKRRGRPLAVTTTLAEAAAVPELLDHAARANLSVDPHKGAISPARIDALAAALKSRNAALDVVLVVSLTDERFAERLIAGGLLAELVDLPAVDKVALNALKPPPPWCDRAFFMRALAALRPLLARALDKRLFLDCWVAARLLHLGGCPARPDLSPATGGVAFRACVYQPSPDLVVRDADALTAHLRGFTAPEVCPFTWRDQDRDPA